MAAQRVPPSRLGSLYLQVTKTADAAQAQIRDALMEGFGARGARKARIEALVAVALGFWTWRRLKDQGMRDADAASLMADAVARG